MSIKNTDLERIVTELRMVIETPDWIEVYEGHGMILWSEEIEQAYNDAHDPMPVSEFTWHFKRLPGAVLTDRIRIKPTPAEAEA